MAVFILAHISSPSVDNGLRHSRGQLSTEVKLPCSHWYQPWDYPPLLTISAHC